MSGNSIGRLFTVTTFGESHGVAIGCIVDGCPPGLALCEADLQQDLDRRKPGTSQFTTQRRESDLVQILSGVFEGKTTGAPIALVIHNQDQRSKDYSAIKDTFRPGHADLVYEQKYGFRDFRGGGRSSARETAARVAAGGIAKKFLSDHCGIHIFGYLSQMGDIFIKQFDPNVIETNPFFCPDPDAVPLMEAMITRMRKAGSSIGAKVEVLARGVPPGLGEPVFDRLDAELARALMSINAVKAVSVGDGFDVVTQRGEQHRDECSPSGYLSNHSGGVLGGISTGQDIKLAMALKPTSSITIPGQSVNRDGQAVEVVTKGRHDPCVGVRATPIAEAMVAIVLMDHWMRNQAQNGTVEPIKVFGEVRK